MSELDEKLEIDCIKIRNAIRLQLPIEITTYTLPRNMEIYILKILEQFLKECHQEHMYEYLHFCLGELLTNSKKANTKRVYFKEKNLDINNPEDYEKGMVNFKEDTLTNINYYLDLQKKAGLYIKLSLQLKGEQIKLEIKNNAKITVFEKERIEKKINSVQQYNSMEDVFLNVLDQSEGAGLGIIIIILMLEKIGLSKDNYQVITTEEETITRITLPCNSKIFAGNEILNYEFVKMQDKVPVLQDNYNSLKEILSTEDEINRAELLPLLQKDITISLLFLKTSIKKNPNIIKLNEVIDLLSDDEIRQIFEEDDKTFFVIDQTEEKIALWKHSQQVAFFAYNFVKNYPQIQDTISPDEAYTLGLMSNLGFLFLNNSSEEQREYVRDLSSQFSENEKISDVFYIGNTSPYITMIYTKKLGFKETFSAILGCWNNNDLYPQNIRDASYILYISELMQFYNEGVIDFYQIDKTILQKFEITTEEQLKYLIKEMEKKIA